MKINKYLYFCEAKQNHDLSNNCSITIFILASTKNYKIIKIRGNWPHVKGNLKGIMCKNICNSLPIICRNGKNFNRT